MLSTSPIDQELIKTIETMSLSSTYTKEHESEHYGLIRYNQYECDSFDLEGVIRMASSARVSVKLTINKKNELEDIASRYGVSASMLGAYILGRFMDEKEEEKKRLAAASAVNYGPGVLE